MGTVARRNVGYTHSLVALEDDAVDASIGSKVEIRLDIHDAVNIGYTQMLERENISRKKLLLPVAASLRLPVCLLIYLAQISEAFAVLQSNGEVKQIPKLSGKDDRDTLDII